MYKLVLIRHGESVWNKENRFTGWTDVGLTKKGESQAHKAGKLLEREGFCFDVAFTSRMKKAYHTLNIILKELKLKIPVVKEWRLNEKHYGALQGLNKSEMAEKYGEKQVLLWRRSYNVRPPALKKTDKRWPGNQALYKDVPKSLLPVTESLKDCYERVLPCWKNDIAPEIRKGKKVLIAAHGNSLRALIKYLDKIADKDIINLNLPTGVPIVYELDKSLKPVRHYFLGSKSEIQKAIKEVKAQGKAK